MMSVGYYEEAQRATPQLTDTYRLFMVPRMQHCGGGNAANVLDPVTTVIDWVEGNRAPASMIAMQQKPDGSVQRSRPACPYPQEARHQGGDPDQASSFVCR